MTNIAEHSLEFIADQRLKDRCHVAATYTKLTTEEEFAMSRRNGFGASDISVLLGLQKKWTSPDDCVKMKCTQDYTDAEREIGKKPSVRMGKDLEPMILAQFEHQMNMETVKLSNMYRFNEYPYLTVNYDGICLHGLSLVPVEAKVVTHFGDKYYDWARGKLPVPMKLDMNPRLPEYLTTKNIIAHCEEANREYGIPDYYYAQVQQQMMGLGADYAYLAAWRYLDWSLYVFWIPKDEWLQTQIKMTGYQYGNAVMKRRTWPGWAT
jgi:hypothetical protein